MGNGRSCCKKCTSRGQPLSMAREWMPMASQQRRRPAQKEYSHARSSRAGSTCRSWGRKPAGYSRG
jgi:hypothetical protein